MEKEFEKTCSKAIDIIDAILSNKTLEHDDADKLQEAVHAVNQFYQCNYYEQAGEAPDL